MRRHHLGGVDHRHVLLVQDGKIRMRFQDEVSRGVVERLPGLLAEDGLEPFPLQLGRGRGAAHDAEAIMDQPHQIVEISGSIFGISKPISHLLVTLHVTRQQSQTNQFLLGRQHFRPAVLLVEFDRHIRCAMLLQTAFHAIDRASADLQFTVNGGRIETGLEKLFDAGLHLGRLLPGPRHVGVRWAVLGEFLRLTIPLPRTIQTPISRREDDRLQSVYGPGRIWTESSKAELGPRIQSQNRGSLPSGCSPDRSTSRKRCFELKKNAADYHGLARPTLAAKVPRHPDFPF
nr:hypothetical protein CFP56_10487 [Quercus suber]